MPNREGDHMIVLPREVMEEIVLPKQRRIYEETGKLITVGLVTRQLLAIAHAHDNSHCGCHVDSAIQ